MEYFLEPSNNGLDFTHKDEKTKWSMQINSTVPLEEHRPIEAYYILLIHNGKAVGCFKYENGSIVLNKVKDSIVVPRYVKSIAGDILDKANLNEYLLGEKIVNSFTVLAGDRV